jgi:hypothetical protein
MGTGATMRAADVISQRALHFGCRFSTLFWYGPRYALVGISFAMIQSSPRSIGWSFALRPSSIAVYFAPKI